MSGQYNVVVQSTDCRARPPGSKGWLCHFTGCVVLGKLVNLPVPFLPLKMEIIVVQAYLVLLCFANTALFTNGRFVATLC